MNDPWWIIRWNSTTLQSLLLANYGDGTRRWAAYSLLFPVNEQYPEKIKLAHWKTREEADEIAFNLVVKDVRLTGHLSVEECWIKRCKRCYDCLCGEGNRRRE